MTKLEKFVEANLEVLAVAGYGDNGGGGSNPTYEECPDCHLPKGHLGNHGNGDGGNNNPSGTKPAEPSDLQNSYSIKLDFSDPYERESIIISNDMSWPDSKSDKKMTWTGIKIVDTW